jgi:hypothetical protein
MGEAKARGSYEERRDARLNEMVERAEIICCFRVDEGGQLRMETLARDEPVDETSAAIGFVEYLHANWKQLAGEALALKSTARGAAHAGRQDVAEGVIVLPGGRPANEERDPVILGANGGVISTGQDAGPKIELPASAAAREES